MNDVVLGGVTGDGVVLAGAGAAVVVGGLGRLLVLGEIVETDALPHGVNHDADAEEHELFGRAGGIDGGAGAGG